MEQTMKFQQKGHGLPSDKSHKIFSIGAVGELAGNPYADKIVSYLRTVVEGAKMSNFKEILNMIEEAFYASGEIRYGAKPDPEHVVHVRKIVAEYMLEGKPIPILVPWGSIKGKFGANLDLAEVSAINQMIALYNRITKFYVPGVEFVIRVEDTSGLQLFELDDKTGDVPKQIKKYVEDFRSLVCIMDYTESIGIVLESEMPEASRFALRAHENIKFFEHYLKDTDAMIAAGTPEWEELAEDLASYGALAHIGWKGIISAAQRNYYYNTYKKLYYSEGNHTPEEIADGCRYRLALYMAQAITRRKLAMTGVQNRWIHGHVQVTFVPPVPGVPDGYDMNYVYYRTMPESHCRSHMSPWRSKGYMLIKDTTGGFSMKQKLASFGEEKEYHEVPVELANGVFKVTISVDYVLETK
jgi:hypothetical protein